MRLGLVGYGLLATSIVPAAAAALPVTVDPGAYTGQWNVDTGPWQGGTAELDLAPGRHTLRPGYPGSVAFDVKPDGLVVPLNLASATGGEGRLTLQTATVEVDPGAFAGYWSTQYVTGWRTGAAAVALVPGTCVYLSAGYPGSFLLCVDSAGVSRASNGISAVTTPTGIRFNTVPIDIDPGESGELYQVVYVTGATWGPSRLDLVAGTGVNLSGVTGGVTLRISAPCAVDPQVATIGDLTYRFSCAGAFDATSPTVSLFALPGVSRASSLPVTARLFDASGIAAAEVRVDGELRSGGLTPDALGLVHASVDLAPGLHEIAVHATDLLGNVGSAQSTVRVDPDGWTTPAPGAMDLTADGWAEVIIGGRGIAGSGGAYVYRGNGSGFDATPLVSIPAPRGPHFPG